MLNRDGKTEAEDLVWTHDGTNHGLTALRNMGSEPLHCTGSFYVS